MALYKKLAAPDAAETQLAYKLRYWPGSMLGWKAQKLCSIKPILLRMKHEILEHCNAELTKLFDYGQEWEIVWRFNNIPTEMEWNKLCDEARIFVEFRDYWIKGKKHSVAILSFHYYAAHERDENNKQIMNSPRGLTFA